MARKTLPVRPFIEWGNEVLVTTRPEDTELRWGVIASIEQALYRTGSYSGYRFLSSEKDEYGLLLDSYDETRREYFLPCA